MYYLWNNTDTRSPTSSWFSSLALPLHLSVADQLIQQLQVIELDLCGGTGQVQGM